MTKREFLDKLKKALVNDLSGSVIQENVNYYNDYITEEVRKGRRESDVIEELGLEDIHTIHGRAEDFAKKKEYREQFDLCVSRAVANLSTLSEYCLPFVAVNGSFVSYKSGDSEEEIHQAKHAISLLGGKVKNVDKFQLPGTDMGRALVEIKKTKQTPGKYPRKAGLPAKEPLK